MFMYINNMYKVRLLRFALHLFFCWNILNFLINGELVYVNELRLFRIDLLYPPEPLCV